MASMALYRKYRPTTFAEVIGQEHVTEPLSQALRSGRLHHAYLFSGPRGCGKTSSARILARSLNCVQGPTPTPCGECESCVALAPDGSGSIDVIEIDAASHGGVDDARELREKAFFAPVSSRFKVYVIDEAHMVSSAGFNALLKLVEEPPEYVMFVFATTEPEKVLPTIKSRTHHYPFRLVPPGVLRTDLERICAAEGVSVEPAVFPLVVRAGGGSVRDAQSIMDQLISGAGDGGVTYARAVALLGVTDVALIDDMCDALAAADGAGVFATVDRVVEAGHDPRRYASDLLDRLRDLIVLTHVPDAAVKGLLDVPPDELEHMTGQALRLGTATLSRMASIVHDGLTEMRGTTAPRLTLELLCTRMLLPGADDSDAALLQRLERMERRLDIATPVAEREPTLPEPAPAEAPRTAPVANKPAASQPAASQPVASKPAVSPTEPGEEPPTAAAAPPARETAKKTAKEAAKETAKKTAKEPAPTPPAPVADRPTTATPDAPVADVPASPGALDATAVRRVWDEIVRAVNRRRPRVAAFVREGTVLSVDGNTLVLGFRHALHADGLQKSPAAEVFGEALTEVIGGRWQIRCEVGNHAGGAKQPPAGGSAPSARQPAGGTPPAGWPAQGGTPNSAATAAAAGPASGPESNGAGPGTPPEKNRGNGRAAATPAGGDEPWPDMPTDLSPDDPPGVRYDGFDPGDEPLDVVDDGQPRRTSEELALALLQETLGAEKIGEVERR